MNKTVLKCVVLLLAIEVLFACSSGRGSSNNDSLNYSSLNYASLNYSDYTGPFIQAFEFSRNLVTDNDPSALVGVTYLDQIDWVMPDSRSDTLNLVSAFRFIADYETTSIEILVNPEFGDQATAEVEARYYAEVIGRIPLFLRDGINNGVSFMYLHQGFEPLVGNQNYLAIYIDRARQLDAQGILEEVLIHESAHVSLDADLAGSSEWLSAQSLDGNTISQLAYDLGNDEDAAETVLAYIAAQYKSNRLSATVEDRIRATIPNRIDYFNSRAFTMNPIVLDLPGAWDNATALTSFFQHPSLFAYYAQWEQTVIIF